MVEQEEPRPRWVFRVIICPKCHAEFSSAAQVQTRCPICKHVIHPEGHVKGEEI